MVESLPRWGVVCTGPELGWDLQGWKREHVRDAL